MAVNVGHVPPREDFEDTGSNRKSDVNSILTRVDLTSHSQAWWQTSMPEIVVGDELASEHPSRPGIYRHQFAGRATQASGCFSLVEMHRTSPTPEFEKELGGWLEREGIDDSS